MVDLNAARLQEGFDRFNAVREQGDIDLVEMIRSALINFEFSAESINAYETDPLILDAKSKTSDIQRWMLNRFWVQQLSCLNVNTINERICLIADGTVEDWLRLQQAYVLPFAKANGLPKVVC